LTFVGRLLLIATLLVSGGLFTWIVLYAKDRMPSGSYPIALVLIPVIMGAAVFFVVIESLLRMLDIQWEGHGVQLSHHPDQIGLL
jgi:hypothetical protein